MSNLQELIDNGDWRIDSSFNYCSSIADGTHDTPKPVREGVPLYTSKNLTDSNRLDKKDVYCISRKDMEEINKRSYVKKFDILYGMIGTVGNPVIIEEENCEFSVKNVCIFRFDGDEVKSRWFYYSLKSEYIEKQINRLLDGSTQKFIPLGTLRSLYVPFPLKDNEQKKITKILSTIDSLIEKTEALINKYQAIKQGMMHDLFTRGIDTNCQLRPNHHDSPYLYKQTELGWIPKEWEVNNLGSLILNHQAGVYKNRELFGDGDNIVGVSDLYRANSIDGQKFRLVPLTETEKITYTLKEGDLIYGESSLVLEGIARTLWVTEKGAGTAFSWHTRKIVVDKNKVDSEYLCYLLNSERIRKKIMSVATQTALTGMTTKDFFSVPISLPNLDEQRGIAKEINQSDRKINNENCYLEKLQLIKKGLMQDLLTGKVRVVN